MKEELIKNAHSFWKSAELIYKTADYTSATLLYFKCLFVLADYAIYSTIKKTPKDHSERFRLLESNLPKLYEVLDKYYPLYRDTYTSTIDKTKCDEVREHALRIIKEQNIQI